jgi:hypothetical protein
MKLPAFLPQAGMLIITIAVFALIGCAGHPIVWDVPTSPDSFSLDPATLSHLRGANAVTLKNAYQGEAKIVLSLGRSAYAFDQKQMTETTIVMLQRAMEKRGIAAAAQADRSLILRVHGLAMQFSMGPGTTAHLTLEVQFGDGSTTAIAVDNRSPVSPQRAFDGALLFALNRLVTDERFVAYLNR